MAASVLGDPPSGAGTFTTSASASIATTTTGRLLVEGHATNVSLTCSGAGACSQSFELFVDGAALPKTTYTLSLAAGASRSTTVAVNGIKDGVAAGTHTVELRTASAGNVATFTPDSSQVVALLAGG